MASWSLLHDSRCDIGYDMQACYKYRQLAGNLIVYVDFSSKPYVEIFADEGCSLETFMWRIDQMLPIVHVKFELNINLRQFNQQHI